MQFDKLFICSGLEPDYSQVEGLIYALDDSQNNVFSAYHFDKAVSKMAIFTYSLKKRLINFQKLTQKDVNFFEHGNGNVVYSCLYNDKRSTNNQQGYDGLQSENNKLNIDLYENDKFYNLHLINEFYSHFFECVNNIILLYDLLKKNRKGIDVDKYMESINFMITIPYSKEFFIENLSLSVDDIKTKRFDLEIEIDNYNIDRVIDNTKIILTDFIMKELEKRKIKILWDYKLKKITLNNKLLFSNGNEIEYNFCYVSPNLNLPKIIKYGILDSTKANKEKEFNNQKEKNQNSERIKNIKMISEMKYFEFDENLFLKEYIDYNSLKLKPFEDIYILGDTLKNFYDRQYHNVVLQAHTLANNIKIENFGLSINLYQDYENNKNLFIDYDTKHYLFLNNRKIEIVKKNFWNNYIVEKFYRESNNKWMIKYLLKKRLKINLFNLK